MDAHQRHRIDSEFRRSVCPKEVEFGEFEKRGGDTGGGGGDYLAIIEEPGCGNKPFQ